MTEIDADTWRRQRAEYSARVRPLAADRIHRAGRGLKHSVYDFLFEYYPHPPAKLLAWSPGPDVILLGATPEDTGWPTFFKSNDGGVVLRAADYPEKKRPRLRRDLEYLRATESREPQFGCFGLHEWAMLYRTADRRHDQLPLRLPQEELDATVETLGLRCSHFDAFRFFTEAAGPRNRVSLSRADAIEHEQPGCVHATMDLYRFAYRLSPFVRDELLAECFLLAVEARELDMRASPYDLRPLGFEPILIETREGREQYVREQAALSTKGIALRKTLVAIYGAIETERPRSA